MTVWEREKTNKHQLHDYYQEFISKLQKMGSDITGFLVSRLRSLQDLYMRSEKL